MDITRDEEKALGIKEKVTVAWREEKNILGTESLLEMIQTEVMQKGGRSDTAISDSCDQKRARVYAKYTNCFKYVCTVHIFCFYCH